MSGRVRGPRRIRDAADTDWWWPVADLAALGGLVVLASLVLIPAYGSAAPVLAALAGAGVPVLVLSALRWWSLPTWAAALLIPLGVVAVGALLIAPQQRVAVLLPAPDAVRTVLEGSLGGWRELLTAATPTGVAGSLLVPPLLIAAAAATTAGILVATARATVAVVGPAAALVADALFADLTASRAIVVAVAVGTLVGGLGWVVWVGARARRRGSRAISGSAGPGRADGPARAQRSLLVRRVVVGAVILTGAAIVAGTVAGGGVTDDRAALRAVVQPTIDPTAFDSPLARFRTFTKQHPDDVQLVVQGLPAGGRLRLAALDDYDGRQFRLSDAEGPFQRIGPTRPAPEGGAPVEVNVRVADYQEPFLPLPGPIVELDFAGDRAADLAADLRYSEPATTGLLPGGWRTGDSYRAVAAVFAQPTGAQLATARPLPGEVGATALPDVLRSAVDRYITGATSPAEQVEAIRAGLVADGVFSHGGAGEPRSPAGHGLGRLTAMVGDGPMVGDQEQYAALMAVLVRSLGIPARVVVGFVPPETANPDREVELHGRDVTAWVEVPFDGFGWVAFDPSPAPDKPITPEDEQAQTERRQVAVAEPPALPQVQPDTVDTESADQSPQDVEPSAPTAADPFMPALVLAMVGWTLLVVAVVAAPIVAVLVVKARRRRRRRDATRPADRITGGWQELLDAAVDTGYRPESWQTRAEVARDLAGTGVLQVEWLAPAADAAQFSPTPVDDERARRYWREVDDRSAELLAGLGFWRRWRARLSLASLRHPGNRRRG